MERKTRIGAALKDFQAREVDRILSACTRAESATRCARWRAIRRRRKATERRWLPGVLAVLRGEQGSAAALGWIAVCTRSGVCVPACPESVDPR